MPDLSFKTFQKNFRIYEVPEVLNKLLDFQNKSHAFYSNGFELDDCSDQYGLNSYSKDNAFLSRLIEFAKADGSGSTYAFWIQEDNDIEKAPIIIFGNGGGVHVVAENIMQLMKILTYDAEPMVDWDDVVYYKDEEDEPSERSQEFKEWLLRNYNIKPIDDADQLVKQAQEKYKDSFIAWMNIYYKP